MSNCQRCETLSETIDRLKADVESLQAQNMANLRIIGRLRAELAEQRDEEPVGGEVKELLAYAKATLGKRSDWYIGLDGSRAKLAKTTLKKYGMKRCKQAVDGLAAKPHVGPRGRSATPYPGSTRRDELSHCWGDDERFTRCEQIAASSRPLERVLGKLENVREDSVGQWMACCPAHDDRHASLRVAQGREGVLLRCNAGCSFGAVAAALGERETDLFDREPVPAAPKPNPDPLPSEEEVRTMSLRLLGNEKALRRVMELRRWTKPALAALDVGFDGQRLVFPVRDEKGALVNLLRYKPGDRRDGERKLLATRGRPRELFPAPELHDGEVWLVEGEPDAVSGLTLGLPTTAVPGVNGWRSNWTGRFEGRRVVVCFDCDAPGRAAAAKVALTLASSAKDVRLVDLAPDRTDGFDLTDFLVAGGDAERVRELAESAGSVMAHRRAA